MDEVFVEQIIKRKINISGMLLRLLSIFIVLIGILSIMWLGILGFTITALLMYGAYMIWSYTSIEYEYSFLNGELTIDKIMGQRKRKTLKSYDIKEADVVAPLISDQVVRASENALLKDYSSGAKNGNLYAMIINNAEGKIKVLFEPNEKVLDAMYHVRPNIVVKGKTDSATRN